MAISDAKKRANNKYNNKTYGTMIVRVKKADKDIITAHANKFDGSVNKFLQRAIYNQIELDNAKSDSSEESSEN